MNKEELKELAATLNGIADGKAWERTNSITGEWCDPDHCGPELCITMGRKIRLKPWSLPPPPGGMQWHREDGWNEEMLPEGYRPLLSGEPRVIGDQFFFVPFERSSEWVDCSGPPATPNSPDSAWCHHRTRRPLPQPDPYAELKAAHAAGKVIQVLGSEGWYDTNPAWSKHGQYRIKPEQQKAPLGPGDVPPGSVLRRSEWLSAWQSIFGAYDRGVSFNGALWEWDDIIDTHQINRSIPLTGKWNPEAWQPCYKLIDTP